MEKKLKILSEKKKQLDAARPLPLEVVNNLDEWFGVELTYTSNAIEGNTLSRAETAMVVEKGMTIGGKSLKEHLEAINHVQALEYIKTLVRKNKKDVTNNEIRNIHKIILSKIDDRNAGKWRTVPVRIAGSDASLPDPSQVPQQMNAFTEWLHGAQGNPVTIAAQAHLKFVIIHPFVDGNGRTARLLMNLLLMQEGYPPAVILVEDRMKYINAIQKAHRDGSTDDYFAVIYNAVERSLDVYLETVSKL